jgi:hypothetical protein
VLASLPDVLATMTSRGVVLCVLLVTVVLADGVGLELAGVRLCAHAEPEIVPVVGAGAHLAIAKYGVPLAAERVASPGEIEGLAARHVCREQGFGEGVAGGRGGRLDGS